MMYNLIIYHTIANPYFRIVRVADGSIMATLTGVLSKTTVWATSATALTKSAILGGIPLTIPKDLPPGDYDLLICSNATPAEGDVPIISRRIAWMGENRLVAGVPLSVVSI